MDEARKLARNAGIVGSLTFVSRILGFARDACLAWLFGAGFSSDAFFVAFRIPNLVRRLFSEGILSLAFIPVFIQYLTHHGKAEAFFLVRSAFKALLLFLTAVASIGIFLAPFLVILFAPGFWDNPEKFALTVKLTRILFPFIVFVGLGALCMGILNTLGHFSTPAFAPALVNLSIIGAVFLISPLTHWPVVGVAAGVLIGGALQLMVMIPPLLRRGIRFFGQSRVFHPAIKKIGLLTLPSALGASVYQINLLFDTVLASFLAEGNISHLYYADRLVQFPLGIFAIAMAIAVLPDLAREAAIRNYQRLGETLISSMRYVLFITVPSMVGIIVLREPIISVLFQRGAFDLETVRLTSQALLYYGLGLWAFSSVRIVVSTFFAMNDIRTPFRIAAISIAAKIVLAIALIGPMGYRGLALSTSLASVVNLVLLIHALGLILGDLPWMKAARSVYKILAASLAMGIVVWALEQFTMPDFSASLQNRLMALCGCILTGVGVYIGLAAVLGSSEWKELSAAMKRKRSDLE